MSSLETPKLTLRARIAFALSMSLALSGVASSTASSTEEAPRSVATTIAGNGRLGIAHGDALETSFVLPVGVSVAPDDSVLIADAGANAIYRLTNGAITRVAGKTTFAGNDETEGATGGYVNGPVASAEFYRPVAAVERADGAILVADNANHCIRLIQGGKVTTFAGSTTAGAADGNASSASFKSPSGLAFDRDGNLLVADFGVGIRRISKDGQVTTLPFGRDPNDILAIAAAELDGHQIIAYTEVRAIHLVVDGKDEALPFNRDRMPDHEGIPVFNGWGIAILNQNTVAVSDVVTSVIRLIRFPVLPFTDVPASEALSGTLHEDTDFNGGFRDGAGTAALYNGPRGIALDRRGRLVIADAGNRRIRRLAGFSSRETVLPDFSNYVSQPGAFGVVIIGQSFLFNGVLWPDSTPGVLESELAREAPAAGLKRPVHVEGVRADGIGFATMASVANESIEPAGNVDTIVFMLTENTYAPVDDVVTEANLLAKSNIKTVLVVLPLSHAVSIEETPFLPTFEDGCACVPTVALLAAHRLATEGLQFAYQHAGLQTIPLLEPMIEAERAPVPDALFDMYDTHLSVAGQRLLGRIFAASFLRDRPWERVHAKTIALQDRASERACPKAPAPAGPATIGRLDALTVQGAAAPLKDGEALSSATALVATGWAADASQAAPARGVCILVDGTSGFTASGSENEIRLDVARTSGHRELGSSGFALTVKPGTLPPGRHTIGIGVVQTDGKLLAAPGARAVEIK